MKIVFENYKKSRFFSNLLISSISLILCLSILEAILRVSPESKKGIPLDWAQKNVKFNKQGFRDVDHTFEKPFNIFRILVLGDSQTFGHGIPKRKDTWPKKLESLLNQDTSLIKFEVLNMAISGWNTDTQLNELFRLGFRYKPDLILLGFYPNDISKPALFKCNSDDREILPSFGKFQNQIQSLKLYQFLKFRLNRLLEKLNLKPSYPDCINRVFQTRGWEMEKIYLDILLMSSQLKNIPFMMTIIPMITSLNNNYPLNSAFEKLNGFCLSRQINCVDLFKESFYGLNDEDYIYSEWDRHLNEKGTRVVAQTLYKKLKLLKESPKLALLNKALSPNLLLNDNPLLKNLERQIPDNHDEIFTAEVNQKNEQWTLKRLKDGYTLKIKVNDIKTGAPQLLSITTLDINGQFLSREKSFYKPRSGFLDETEILETKDGITFLKIKKYQETPDGLTLKSETSRIFPLQVFDQKKIRGTVIEFEKGTIFPDPKVLEKRIFSKGSQPSEHYSEQEMIQILKNIINRNPPAFPDLTNKKTLELMPQSRLVSLFNEVLLFQDLIILNRYGGNEYIQKLRKAVKSQKPPLEALKAFNRLDSHLKPIQK